MTCNMAWKNLCNDVEILSQYPEVGLAISDSTSPVPGYLYGEINSTTYVEYGKNCKPLVNFLVSRLDADSPIISEKVLKLLLHLVKNGYYEMIDSVKMHEVTLKEAAGFHGPPDILHGKSVYESIRKIAKDLLEYVFSENIERNESMVSPSDTKLTGYGSDNYSSSKLPGFGYSVKSQKSVTDLVTDGLSNFVEKIFLSEDTKTKPEPESHFGDALPQFKPLVIKKNLPDCVHEEVSKQSNQVSHKERKKPRVYKPGRPGGGWDDSEEEEDVESPFDTAIEDVSKESVASLDSDFDFSKVESKDTTTDWLEERKVVNEFTVNENLNKMSFATISSLCKRCSALNCDKILVYLVEKLVEHKENVQLRALILVEYLVFHDIATLESLQRIVSPSLNDLLEKDENIPVSVKIKTKKMNLIIQSLAKIYQQQQIERNQCREYHLDK